MTRLEGSSARRWEPGPFARVGSACLAIALSALATAACKELTPEEQVERLRAQYSATVNSISFPERASGDASLAEPGIEPETAPRPIDVLVDVLVSTEATEKLAGLTLDVSHADKNGKEKEHRLLWIDTSDLERGPGVQVTLTLEDIDYAEGDGFHVEVRSPIPPQERRRYRELEQAMGADS